MSTELQEYFKNYVFEDVKANIDEWRVIDTRSYGEMKRNFIGKIIELRRQYAKESGLKTVTLLCPKPSDLVNPVIAFLVKYVRSEKDRIYEEYKPLAIAKIVNDEALRNGLNETLSKDFSEYDGVDFRNAPYLRLRDILKEHYDEIKHTLSNPANAVRPHLGDLANELLTSLFTPQLVLKTNNTEQIKEAS
ncbi:hypothetical protein C0030_003665 [Candidatus Liberibacter solanacearum]|uniref:Uncharacterized protein n=1 Tax=Candidatus Liberibacter solanacearum TaxID=556287 RepID=A0A424FLY9_9HYPH|nr:hypothetical protein [Candidatus Liberibacter solanacearum]RPD37180.1 hypothetical protein C0030_003665 [Candidatus Liberibacter solanacearum]